MTRDEHEAGELFSERYRTRRQDVHREIERAVIGSDWGANGYTTLRQADTMRDLLQLRAGDTLVDAGAGRGWPGLYLATTTDSRLVAFDLPLEGLAEARERARQEGLADRFAAVVASASAPPLPRGFADGIVASDVFC